MKQNIFKRLFVKPEKKNPDWARIEEPDTIIQPMVIAVMSIVITAFSVLVAWNVMTTSPIEWIANFLVSLHSTLPFNQLYAAFASAVIVLVNLVLVTLFIFFAPSSNDDIVEMISDLDSNTQERIVELENTFNEKLNQIINNF